MAKTAESMIFDILQELSDPNITKQRERFLKDQMDILMRVKDKHSPISGFQEFCLMNPDAAECKEYDC